MDEIKNKKSSLTTKVKHGGARKGAGRKPGVLMQKTKDKMLVVQEMRDRVIKNVDGLLNSQINLAKGVTFLYRIDEEMNDKGKVKRKHVLVEDPEEIRQVLDENGGEGGNVNEHYYYMTTQKPDNQALESLFNRAFGKAKESVDVNVEGKVEMVQGFNYVKPIEAKVEPTEEVTDVEVEEDNS